MPKVLNQRVLPKHLLLPGVPLPTYIYVGRPSPWGNPERAVNVGRPQALENHLVSLEQMAVSTLRRLCAEIAGKDIVCWCAPLSCHADTWLSLANPELPLPSWMNDDQMARLTVLREKVHGPS